MNILIYLFIVYSFLGWVFETTIAAIKRKRFVNRGIINGPFCVIYGISAVAITVILRDLNGFWLLFGSMIVATLIEWTGGHIIGKMYHEAGGTMLISNLTLTVISALVLQLSGR